MQPGRKGKTECSPGSQINTIKLPSNLSLSSLTVLVVSVMKGVCVFRNEGFYGAASISCNSRNTLLLSANSYFCLSLEGTVVRQFQVCAQVCELLCHDFLALFTV